MNRFKRTAGFYLYKLGGSRPWTTGYHAYKIHSIEQGILEGVMMNPSLPDGYGYRVDERVVEYPWFFSRLPIGQGRILDAGSTLNFEYILSLPILKNKQIYISTLMPESNCYWKRGVSYVYEDLRNSGFCDRYFDWIVCISTLEHVGMDNTRVYGADARFMESNTTDHLLAVREFRRLIKPGGTLYLTVPFGKYAHHGWLQVFDKDMIDRVITEFGPATLDVNYFHYLPTGWRRASWQECKHETLFDIHKTGKYDPDFAASARAVACLEFRVER